MRKLAIIFLALTSVSLSSYGQTAQEIISRMETKLESPEYAGVEMIVDAKIPLLGGNVSKSYSLGNKSRMESKVMGVEFITWTDGQYNWTYIINLNQVEITDFDSESDEINDDREMFIGITDGYDVSIMNETPDSWHIQGVKSKSNTDKEAPKKMEIVVAKDTYLPVSLSAKGHGISVVMKDIKFGATEKDVVFNADDYPGVKIIDKRLNNNN